MIDFIILSKTDSDKIFSMTLDLIQSLQDTEYPADTSFSDYRITIVESNPESKYVYPESCDVVPFDFSKYSGFNYNYALNLGIRRAAERRGMDWICVMNNDIVCKSDWIVEISRQYEKHPEVQSICANIRNWQPGAIFGHTLHQHVDGCCIMYRHELNEIMQLWDERFSFMYQDDDYCMQLCLHDIKHMRVLSSMIFHIGSQSQTETNSYREKCMAGQKLFLTKYPANALIIYENMKQQFLSAYRQSLKYEMSS